MDERLSTDEMLALFGGASAPPCLKQCCIHLTYKSLKSHTSQWISIFLLKRECGKQVVVNHHFQATWFSKWTWLHYRKIDHRVFCHTCVKTFKAVANLGIWKRVEECVGNLGFMKGFMIVCTKRSVGIHKGRQFPPMLPPVFTTATGWRCIPEVNKTHL